MQRRSALIGLMACAASSAHATPESMMAAIQAFAGGAAVQPSDKVKLDIAPLVENGNAVPITVSVDHPVEGVADAVRAIAIFNERNPQQDVGVFTISAHSGRAFVATRIRLATSQKLVVLARLADGSCWSQSVDVVVTLAACTE